MANIASILKEQILRLAKKEARKEVEGLRKASSQYRSDIAALKRQLAALVKQQARAEKKNPRMVKAETEGEGGTHFRFSAKRFAAQRQKLGLSAADLGTLLGVSAQTVYHWESGKTRPRQSQLPYAAISRSRLHED